MDSPPCYLSDEEIDRGIRALDIIRERTKSDPFFAVASAILHGGQFDYNRRQMIVEALVDIAEFVKVMVVIAYEATDIVTSTDHTCAIALDDIAMMVEAHETTDTKTARNITILTIAASDCSICSSCAASIIADKRIDRGCALSKSPLPGASCTVATAPRWCATSPVSRFP